MFKYKRPGEMRELYQVDREFNRLESCVRQFQDDIELLYKDHETSVGNVRILEVEQQYIPVANYPGLIINPQGMIVYPGVYNNYSQYGQPILGQNGNVRNYEQYQIGIYSKKGYPIKKDDKIQLSATFTFRNTGYTQQTSPKINIVFKAEEPFLTRPTTNFTEIDPSSSYKVIHVDKIFTVTKDYDETQGFAIYFSMYASIVHQGPNYDTGGWMLVNMDHVVTHVPKE